MKNEKLKQSFMRATGAVCALLVLACVCLEAQASPLVVTVSKAGTLSALIGPEKKNTTTQLKVAGPINGTDVLYLREMLGRGQYGEKTEGQLRDLDLSEARIVAGGDSYIYYNSFTADDVVGENMFGECDQLERIVLPAGTKQIGRSAFYRCSRLGGITIPDSVESIGENCFFCDSALESISIPSGVQEIGLSPLAGCVSLKSIAVDPANTHYCAVDGALLNKAKTEFVNVPCGRTGDFVVPSTVTFIADGAFNQCMLSKITLPASVDSLGEAAFSNSPLLKSINIPDKVKELPYGTFVWCESLTDVTFGSSLKTIDEMAFVACNALQSITIPNSVKNIGSRVFSNCASLATVNLGAGVESLGQDVFITCKKLKEINVDGNNSTYSSIDGVLCDKSQHTLLKCPEGREGSYSVPASVQKIDEEAFTRCTYLTSVEMGDNVSTIMPSAFDGCKGLTSAKLSNTLTQVSEYAFSGCESLKSIDLGSGVKTIANGAFSGCKALPYVQFPASLETIGTSAFDYCTGLTSLRCLGETPAACKSCDDSFYKVDPKAVTVYVPLNAVEAYKAADAWKEFNIVGENYTGVSRVDVEPSWQLVDVYDLNGRLIASRVNRNSLILDNRVCILKDVATGATQKVVFP